VSSERGTTIWDLIARLPTWAQVGLLLLFVAIVLAVVLFRIL
jgi:hypothetical protein